MLLGIGELIIMKLKYSDWREFPIDELGNLFGGEGLNNGVYFHHNYLIWSSVNGQQKDIARYNIMT